LEDMIRLPSKESFHNPEFYYSSRFHEMVHATGHESRLARSGIVDTANFASDPYCREELVAEMGAAFLSGYTGIENIVIDNSAAYIDSWLGRLNKDNKLVVTAGAQAQKAADYVLGNKPTYSQ
jgi:antirestriction protein ArdC